MKAFFVGIALVFSTLAIGDSDVALNLPENGIEGEYAFEEAEVTVETFAGSGLPGYSDGALARFNMPHGVLAIAESEVVVFDTFNNLVRFVSYSETATLAGRVLSLDQFGFPEGYHYDGYAHEALFDRPMGGAIDSLGRIFVADSFNNAIRLIDGGYVYTFAGDGIAGHVDGYVSSARFHHPSDIAFGPCGSLFVADSLNHVVRKIDVYGIVSTIAGIPGVYGYNGGFADESLFNSPMGIAVNDDGAIFVSDTGNHLIRRIEGGYVSTFAGELLLPSDIEWEIYGGDFDEEPIGGFRDGYNALFNLPKGIAVFGDSIIVADAANHAVRRILASGYVELVAGGDVGAADGYAELASFHFPRGVYVFGEMIFVADSGNNLIRVIKGVQNESSR